MANLVITFCDETKAENKLKDHEGYDSLYARIRNEAENTIENMWENVMSLDRLELAEAEVAECFAYLKIDARLVEREIHKNDPNWKEPEWTA